MYLFMGNPNVRHKNDIGILKYRTLIKKSHIEKVLDTEDVQ